MITFHIEILFGTDFWTVSFTMSSFIAVVADHIRFRICDIRTFFWSVSDFATIITSNLARTVLNRNIMSLFGGWFLVWDFRVYTMWICYIMHYVSYLCKMSRLVAFKARFIIFWRLGWLNYIFWVVFWFYLYSIWLIDIFACFLQVQKSYKNTV